MSRITCWLLGHTPVIAARPDRDTLRRPCGRAEATRFEVISRSPMWWLRFVERRAWPKRRVRRADPPVTVSPDA